jgi:hypothetical protein
MTKLKRAILITLGVVVVIGLVTIPLFACSNKEGRVLNKGQVIPTIDAAAPAVIETATFGVG